VQREREQMPFALTTEELQGFVRLALEGLVTPVRVPAERQDIPESPSEVIRNIETLDMDAFRFAREHLARCL